MIVDKFQQGPLSNELLGATNQLQRETLGVLEQRGGLIAQMRCQITQNKVA